jgi:hypothetical protein
MPWGLKMSDTIPMTPREQRAGGWNDQLAEWVRASGKSITDLGREFGLPRTTLKNYVGGEVSKLDKVSYENRRKLYEMTKLECFKCEAPACSKSGLESATEKYHGSEIGGPSAEEIRKFAQFGKMRIESLVDNLKEALGFDGYTRLKAGILKAQTYSPDARERADAIVELIEVLGNEVDYFRTANQDERQILNKKLRENSDSLGYATQMLNIIYNGKGMDSWMLLSQPPAKVRQIMRNPDTEGGK